MAKFIVVVFILLLVVGCQVRRSVILTPIQDTDFRQMKAGQPYSPPLDGYFISNFFFKKVMEAQVQD